MGTPWSFLLALSLVVVWALSGPMFGFSDTWELIINTATTIITFLMVFLIQNTQNRDAKALHLKLDELIYAISKADNSMIDIEDMSPDHLEELAKHFQEKCKHVSETRERVVKKHGKHGKPKKKVSRSETPTP